MAERVHITVRRLKDPYYELITMVPAPTPGSFYSLGYHEDDLDDFQERVQRQVWDLICNPDVHSIELFREGPR
jgi:hypothetical protein